MKKNIKFFSLALATIVFASCNKDDATNDSQLIFNPNVTGTITTLPSPVTVPVTPPLAFGVTPIVVNEIDNNTFNFKLTLSEPVPVPVVVKSIQIAGNATIGVDYDIADIVIPAYATSATGQINILMDDLVEGDETATIQISDVTTGNAHFQAQNVTFTIKNGVKDQLDLSFNFDKTFYGANGYSNSLCNLASSITAAPNNKYDIDFIVYDAAWTDLGVVDAQTGACNEKLSIKLSDPKFAIDQTYHITAFLWTNADLDFAMLSFPLVGSPQFDIPVTVDYLRSGSINKGTYTQEAANYFNSNTAAGTESAVMDVVISTVGGVRKFTIQDTAGNISASGRMAMPNHTHIKRNK
jgi:hypothetical protein